MSQAGLQLECDQACSHACLPDASGWQASSVRSIATSSRKLGAELLAEFAYEQRPSQDGGKLINFQLKKLLGKKFQPHSFRCDFELPKSTSLSSSSKSKHSD